MEKLNLDVLLGSKPQLDRKRIEEKMKAVEEGKVPRNSGHGTASPYGTRKMVSHQKNGGEDVYVQHRSHYGKM